jgi:hypothetical protein
MARHKATRVPIVDLAEATGSCTARDAGSSAAPRALGSTLIAILDGSRSTSWSRGSTRGHRARTCPGCVRNPAGCPKSGQRSDKSTSRAGLPFGHAEPQIPSSTEGGVFGLLGSVRTLEFKALSGAIE